MANLELWSQARGRLIILFILVVLPPAVTLVVLGIQLLEQDRVAARQQQTEFLEQASEKGVRILEQDLAAAFVGATAAPNPKQEFPEDIIRITCSRDGITSLPPGRLPYFPAAAPSPELPGQPFNELEEQEFAPHNDLDKALAIARGLSASSDPAIRAGALVREGRILRKMNRHAAALSVYERLARVGPAVIDGAPVDLAARKVRCTTLAEMSKRVELLREAAAILADLDSGAWRLDRATFLQVRGQLGIWLGKELPVDAGGEAFAEAAVWLYGRWKTEARIERRRELFQVGGRSLTVMSDSTTEGLSAVVAGPDYARRRWLQLLQAAVAPARAALLGVAGEALAGEARPDRRRESCAPQRIPDCHVFGPPSPDRWYIAYEPIQESAGDLAVYDRVGETRRIVTAKEQDKGEWIKDIAWSPDGGRIAYTRRIGTKASVANDQPRRLQCARAIFLE